MGPFVRSLRFFAGPHGGRLFLQVRPSRAPSNHQKKGVGGERAIEGLTFPTCVHTQASVFAGCDYLASINGIGPITAWELAVKCRCAYTCVKKGRGTDNHTHSRSEIPFSSKPHSRSEKRFPSSFPFCLNHTQQKQDSLPPLLA